MGAGENFQWSAPGDVSRSGMDFFLVVVADITSGLSTGEGLILILLCIEREGYQLGTHCQTPVVDIGG